MCVHVDGPEAMSRRAVLRWMVRSGAVAVGASVLGACVDDWTVDPDPLGGDRIAVNAGCYSASYAGAGSARIGCGFVPSLGNAVLDRQFVEEVQIQSNFWVNVPARVATFDECDPQSMNAIAMPDGNILMGYYMAQRILLQTSSSLPIAGVLAHEWGHQIQFRFNYIDQGASTVRGEELEADAFSGYYMGLAKGWAGSELQKYLDFVASIGDTNFNDPGHHGTPAERRAASTLGMSVAFDVIQTGQYYDYASLHSLFRYEIERFVHASTWSPRPPLDDAIRALVDRLDHDYLDGVYAGTRSVDELQAPRSTPVERARYRPY